MGLGSVFGNDVDAYYDRLLSGESGITPIDRFDASKFPTRFAGQIRGFTSGGYIDGKNDRRLDDCLIYCIVSGKKALENAGIGPDLMDGKIFNHHQTIKAPHTTSWKRAGSVFLFAKRVATNTSSSYNKIIKMGTPLKYCRSNDSLRVRDWTDEFQHKPFQHDTPIAKHGSRKIELAQWLRLCGNFIPERYIMIKISETLPPSWDAAKRRIFEILQPRHAVEFVDLKHAFEKNIFTPHGLSSGKIKWQKEHVFGNIC